MRRRPTSATLTYAAVDLAVPRLRGGDGSALHREGLSPALVNAAVDALTPFGVTHVDMPLTPERLWAAMQGAAAH